MYAARGQPIVLPYKRPRLQYGGPSISARTVLAFACALVSNQLLVGFVTFALNFALG